MMKPTPIAEVVLFKQVHQPLHYSIPEPHLPHLKAGMRVLVPVRGQKATGLVVGFAPKPGVPHLKPILKVLDAAPVMDEPLLKLTRWLSDYYITGWGAAIRAVLPPGLDASPRLLYRLTDQGRGTHASPHGSKTQRAVLKALAPSALGGQQGLTAKTLAHRIRVSSTAKTLQTLIKKGWVEPHALLHQARAHQDAATVEPADAPQQQALPFYSMAQEASVKAVGEALSSQRFEVLCQQGLSQESTIPLIAAAADQVLKHNRAVLILVPEVAQVHTAAAYLATALQRPVGVLHGELKAGLRLATWLKILAGDLPIVVGTRTAVFAPMKALGLIVVTQESDPSHKAEESPPYHVREVALMRGQIHRIPVLLTALAPSVETYAKCQSHQYHALSNTNRSRSTVHGSLQLTTSLVDLKTLRPGQILSGPLVDAITKRLQVGRPVLLLLNRKGFATALICRDCGHVFRCTRCRVAQVLHRQAHRLICHYCGMNQDPPTTCPTCRGIRLGGVGVGIEQAEETLRQTFPKARLLRPDRDISPSGFKTADIYLGTDWIFRWPRLPRLDLVGILDADSYLHLPDFHAGERTFQFIIQAAAWAASAGSGSEVMIQTRYPEHESIAWAKSGDPDLFYKTELAERMALGYPPFMCLAAITIKSLQAARAEALAQKVGQRLREATQGKKGVQILGPAPAPLAQLRGKHRFLILIKASSDMLLRDVIRLALDPVRSRRGMSGVEIGMDVDPLHLR